MSNLDSGLIERVRLCGDHHAIDRLYLGIEWETPLDQQVMAELSSLAQELSELPRRIEIRASETPLSEASSKQEKSDDISELVEIALDNSKGSEETEADKTLEIFIKQTGVFFGVLASTYVSWSDTKEKASRLTRSILGKVLEHRALNSVGLQVVDSFRFDREIELSSVLDKRSDYLPPGVFKRSAYWRFDQSYYDFADPEAAQLTNFQIMHSPVEGDDQLVIACLHRFDLNSPQKPSIAELHARYDELYGMNKRLVGSLLSDMLSKRIGIQNSGDNHES
ncbi:hypothetical protein D9M69_461000 [compost metagenome]